MEAVSAQPANILPRADKSGRVDMRTGGRPLAGTYVYQGDRLVTTVHSHDLHQIEYACIGFVELETASGRFLLPPDKAAWIPAGTTHVSIIDTAVETVSVFLQPSLLGGQAQDRPRIFSVPTLLREMILYATRWPIQRSGDEAEAQTFFGCLVNVVSEALNGEVPLRLPTPSTPALAVALDYTRSHLATATIADAAVSAGLSERTLRRLCAAELNLTWRGYVGHARLLKATALLTDPGTSVLRAATTVGYRSQGAFTRAFASMFGETPTAYRRRIRQSSHSVDSAPRRGAVTSSP
jgi:AraC-like DNA-binding protein